MQKKQSNRQRMSNRVNKDQRDLFSHPPQLQAPNVRHTARLRFEANAAFTGNVTFQNLLDTMLVGVTATGLYDMFYAVKVRAVEVWAESVAGNPVSASIQFSGNTAGFVGDQRIHTDTSMATQPCHVRAVPGKDTLASKYQVSSGNTAFRLEIPINSVVDVELSFIGTFGSAVISQTTGLSLSTGAFYVRGLDGLAVATSKFTATFGTQA